MGWDRGIPNISMVICCDIFVKLSYYEYMVCDFLWLFNRLYHLIMGLMTVHIYIYMVIILPIRWVLIVIFNGSANGIIP